MTLGTVKLPTPAQLAELADELGFTMSEEDLAIASRGDAPEHRRLQRGRPHAAGAAAGELPAHARLPAAWARRTGYGAWYVKTTIEGAADGKLKGKRVAIKDNVCIAGVPMMNGASTLEGYVPDVDATIVTRILDAGGTILGKAVCEYFCFSGGSHTSVVGPGAQPAPRGLLGRRLVVGQRCAARGRRGRPRDRRRPGRLDPHARPPIAASTA